MVPDWSDRYPLIAAEAARLKGSTILDAEVVCASKDGVPDFDARHSRSNDHVAVACAFDLLMLNGDDMWRKPFAERKAAFIGRPSPSKSWIQVKNPKAAAATRVL
jgi:ATP-dependent DNA ligase